MLHALDEVLVAVGLVFVDVRGRAALQVRLGLLAVAAVVVDDVVARSTSRGHNHCCVILLRSPAITAADYSGHRRGGTLLDKVLGFDHVRCVKGLLLLLLMLLYDNNLALL